MIKDSGRKASAIVSDLLTISKGLTAEMELLNLNTVIERYLHSREFTGILQASPGVVVDMDLEPELLDMKGSYFHIEKSLKVLILNAVQEVAENSGGHVEIRTENYLLDADKTENGSRVSGSGEYVSLIVQDNGPGHGRENPAQDF